MLERKEVVYGTQIPPAAVGLTLVPDCRQQ